MSRELCKFAKWSKACGISLFALLRISEKWNRKPQLRARYMWNRHILGQGIRNKWFNFSNEHH